MKRISKIIKMISTKIKKPKPEALPALKPSSALAAVEAAPLYDSTDDDDYRSSAYN